MRRILVAMSGGVDSAAACLLLKKQGYDLFTVVADPLLRDPAHGDFTLDPASPALKMGFVPIDMTGLGIREGRGKEFEN